MRTRRAAVWVVKLGNVYMSGGDLTTLVRHFDWTRYQSKALRFKSKATAVRWAFDGNDPIVGSFVQTWQPRVVKLVRTKKTQSSGSEQHRVGCGDQSPFGSGGCQLAAGHEGQHKIWHGRALAPCVWSSWPIAEAPKGKKT